MGIFDKRAHPFAGRLITFCGLDGCGKTTMIKWLKAYLEKKSGLEKIVVTKQPTQFIRESAIFRNFIDESSHDAYDYRSLSLLAAGDRIQHSNKEIIPWLRKGKWVISDRYFYSCLANLRARGYRDDRWIYEIAGYIPKPDIAFFLDVGVKEAIRRVHMREEEKNKYIDIGLQYSLRDEYLKIAKDVGGIVISGEQPINLEKAYIKRIVDEVLDL